MTGTGWTSDTEDMFVFVVIGNGWTGDTGDMGVGLSSAKAILENSASPGAASWPGKLKKRNHVYTSN